VTLFVGERFTGAVQRLLRSRPTANDFKSPETIFSSLGLDQQGRRRPMFPVTTFTVPRPAPTPPQQRNLLSTKKRFQPARRSPSAPTPGENSRAETAPNMPASHHAASGSAPAYFKDAGTSRLINSKSNGIAIEGTKRHDQQTAIVPRLTIQRPSRSAKGKPDQRPTTSTVDGCTIYNNLPHERSPHPSNGGWPGRAWWSAGAK